MNTIISQNYQLQKTKIEEIIKDLHQLTIEIGHDELAKTVSDLRNRINDPFMFVVVGEVKAGKSSFVNALLDADKEICKVAPQPMTDTIQQIVYGEKEEIVTINPYLKKIFQPIEILKEIAIVDTPGTNTIIEHHQEITERFIPASDLIVFVFEAKNPYRQSAWAFFDYINEEWRKKTIFVLQQKDLMDERDLAVNIKGVEEYAVKKGLTAPAVFAVSAKLEREGKKSFSGFFGIRNYIKEKITGGKAPALKMLNNIATANNINARIKNGISDRRQQWEADVAFREEIRKTLDAQEEKSHKQVAALVKNLLTGYDKITMGKEAELRHGLSFFTLVKRSISSLFSKKASAKEWLEKLAVDLEKDLKLEMNSQLQSGISGLAESIQQMALIIDLKIRNSETVLKNDHEIFSDIADKRANVLKDLQEAFQKFMEESKNFTDGTLFSGNKQIAPNLMTGSGIAVIGAILTSVTNVAVFDITGGVLTAVGLLFAGISTTRRKRQIIGKYHKEIQLGHDRLEQEVQERLNTYVANIKERIDSNFKKFDELLEEEKSQLLSLENRQSDIENRVKALEADLTGGK